LYATIRLTFRIDDPERLADANFAGFTINGIGPKPDYHQPACKQGGATGATCDTSILSQVQART
jgi:hypothetical protein